MSYQVRELKSIDMNDELAGTIKSICSTKILGRTPLATSTTVGIIELPDGRKAQVLIVVNTQEDEWE